MNPFPGGMILVSDFLMYVEMLLLLTLSLLVVFVRVEFRFGFLLRVCVVVFCRVS